MGGRMGGKERVGRTGGKGRRREDRKRGEEKGGYMYGILQTQEPCMVVTSPRRLAVGSQPQPHTHRGLQPCQIRACESASLLTE